MEVKSTRHSKYNINYHLVWIPKNRGPILTGDVAQHLEEIFHIIADKKEVEILSLEIMPDHIHLFVSSPPQHSPSLLINWFKGISSRMYNYCCSFQVFDFAYKIKRQSRYHVIKLHNINYNRI